LYRLCVCTLELAARKILSAENGKRKETAHQFWSPGSIRERRKGGGQGVAVQLPEDGVTGKVSTGMGNFPVSKGESRGQSLKSVDDPQKHKTKV